MDQFHLTTHFHYIEVFEKPKQTFISAWTIKIQEMFLPTLEIFAGETNVSTGKNVWGIQMHPSIDVLIVNLKHTCLPRL